MLSVKTKWIIVLLFALGAILALQYHDFRGHHAVLPSSEAKPRTASGVEVATDTCASNSDAPRIVALHVANNSLSINSEPVSDGQLPERLREIYGLRAERVLYLLSDKAVSSRRIADVVDVVQRLRSEDESERQVPKELQGTKDDLMNIRIMLVTAQTMNTPCSKGYFNWATQRLPVLP